MCGGGKRLEMEEEKYGWGEYLMGTIVLRIFIQLALLPTLIVGGKKHARSRSTCCPQKSAFSQ